jgi:ankyrin repeat protein
MRNMKLKIALALVIGLQSINFYASNEDLNLQLRTAAKNGDIDLVGSLIQNGADPNDKDQYNEETALHKAVKGYCDANASDELNAYTAVLEYLLQNNIKNVDIDAQNDEGKTALFLATEKTNYNAVKFLLEHGADVDIRDDQKQTPEKFITRYCANSSAYGSNLMSNLRDIQNLLLRYES